MKVEDNGFPYVTLVEQSSAPATPATGKAKLYRGTDNKLYIVDDAGAATEVGAGGGSLTVQDENGNVEAGVTVLDFQGANVTAADGAAGEVIVTIGPTVKIKSADESVANSTLQDDDHLTVAIAASEKLVVEWRLYVAQQTNATPDLKMLVTGPAGATIRWGVHGAATTITGTEGDVHVQAHTTGTIQVGLATTADSFVVVSATIENSTTSGTVALQWAQQTADAANPTVIKRGSSMVAHKVA